MYGLDNIWKSGIWDAKKSSLKLFLAMYITNQKLRFWKQFS